MIIVSKMPGWVKLFMWLYAASAALLIITSSAKTWLWEPFAIITALWALLRIAQLRGQRWGESDEAVRNRNTGRTRTPRSVHVITAVIAVTLFWYLIWGSIAHPLPGMAHSALLPL
jgi:hypothetical protein